MRKATVEVGYITPNTYTLSDLKNKNVHCCISLSNPNFYGKRLGAILEFLNKNFKKVLIITPGYLYRHNYKIINSCDENKALELSLNDEEKYLSQELADYKELIQHEKFTISSWEEHFITDEFENSASEVLSFYNKNTLFKDEIEKIALDFLKHNKFLKNRDNLNKDLASECNKKYSIDFILEEIAFFNYLSIKGFEVQLYPGVMLRVLNDIVTNKFIDAPVGLKARINIPVKLKRVGNRLRN